MNTSYIRFTKMHGTGNDFIVLDRITQNFHTHPGLIRRLAHRHFGIGCDQVLLIEAPVDPDADFFYRIFNADGQEVELCANGARCVGHYLHTEGLSRAADICLQTLASPVRLHVDEQKRVSAHLCQPSFEVEGLATVLTEPFEVTLDEGRTLRVYPVSMGNPHAVVFLKTLHKHPLKKYHRFLEEKANLKGFNIHFAEIKAPHIIQARFFERGSGETLSCGSGACAIAAAAIQFKKAARTLKVQTLGGTLKVQWLHSEDNMVLSGSIRRVFQGVFAVTRKARQQDGHVTECTS